MRHRSRSRAPAGRRLNSLAGGTLFTPASIPGLVLWLDAGFGLYQETTGASATTPATEPSDPVGTWEARTGQYATATATTKRPLLGLFGSAPALTFDGVDDFLSTATSPLVGGASASASVFARFYYGAVPLTGKAGVFGQANDQIEMFSDGDAGNFVGRSRDNGTNYRAANLTQVSQGTWYTGGVTNDGPNSLVTAYRGASTATAATSGGLLASTGGFSVGAQSSGALGWLNGSIAALVVYSRPLTAGERSQLFAYLDALVA